MTVMPILRWPDPRLAAVCVAVPAGEDVAGLARDMLQTMYAAPGRGLAAPQVGVLRRVFVMDTGWKEGKPAPMVCINPDILWWSPDQTEGTEGCLSLPGTAPVIRRARAIRLAWTAQDGLRHEALFDGFGATCIQHETDHLDGILTLDRLSPGARAAALAQVQT